MVMYAHFLGEDCAVDCSKSNLFDMDNLSAPQEKTFKKLLLKCRAILHFYPPDCTSELQVIDTGVSAILETYIGELLDAWLEDDSNLEQW